MTITVVTNNSALLAQRSLNSANTSLEESMKFLSTGYRINTAKDDAAGLQISSRMTSQIEGLAVAIRNASDGISMCQTAEGAMTESTAILQRMRELSLQAANGSNSEKDRRVLQAEIQQLVEELDRISDTTRFSNFKLLDGSMGNMQFQVGVFAGEIMSFGIPSLGAKDMGAPVSYDSRLFDVDWPFMSDINMSLASSHIKNSIVDETLTFKIDNVEKYVLIEAGDSAKQIVHKMPAPFHAVAKTKFGLSFKGPKAGESLEFRLNGREIKLASSDYDNYGKLSETIKSLFDSQELTAKALHDGILVELPDGEDGVIELLDKGTNGNISVFGLNDKNEIDKFKKQDIIYNNQGIVVTGTISTQLEWEKDLPPIVELKSDNLDGVLGSTTFTKSVLEEIVDEVVKDEEQEEDASYNLLSLRHASSDIVKQKLVFDVDGNEKRVDVVAGDNTKAIADKINTAFVVEGISANVVKGMGLECKILPSTTVTSETVEFAINGQKVSVKNDADEATLKTAIEAALPTGVRLNNLKEATKTTGTAPALTTDFNPSFELISDDGLDLKIELTVLTDKGGSLQLTTISPEGKMGSPDKIDGVATGSTITDPVHAYRSPLTVSVPPSIQEITVVSDPTVDAIFPIKTIVNDKNNLLSKTTFFDCLPSSLGTAVAAQTLTFELDGDKTTVTVAANDTSAKIAAAIEKEFAAPNKGDLRAQVVAGSAVEIFLRKGATPKAGDADIEIGGTAYTIPNTASPQDIKDLFVATALPAGLELISSWGAVDYDPRLTIVSKDGTDISVKVTAFADGTIDVQHFAVDGAPSKVIKDVLTVGEQVFTSPIQFQVPDSVGVAKVSTNLASGGLVDAKVTMKPSAESIAESAAQENHGAFVRRRSYDWLDGNYETGNSAQPDKNLVHPIDEQVLTFRVDGKDYNVDVPKNTDTKSLINLVNTSLEEKFITTTPIELQVEIEFPFKTQAVDTDTVNFKLNDQVIQLNAIMNKKEIETIFQKNIPNVIVIAEAQSGTRGHHISLTTNDGTDIRVELLGQSGYAGPYDITVHSANGGNSKLTALNDEVLAMPGLMFNVVTNKVENVSYKTSLATSKIGTKTAQQIVSPERGMESAINLSEISVGTIKNAMDALKLIDNGLDKIGNERGSLGAIQNRLDHTIVNLGNIRENLIASRGRIMDTDYAEEMTNMVKYQILKQASIANLAQANDMARDVLMLLQ